MKASLPLFLFVFFAFHAYAQKELNDSLGRHDNFVRKTKDNSSVINKIFNYSIKGPQPVLKTGRLLAQANFGSFARLGISFHSVMLTKQWFSIQPECRIGMLSNYNDAFFIQFPLELT